VDAEALIRRAAQMNGLRVEFDEASKRVNIEPRAEHTLEHTCGT